MSRPKKLSYEDMLNIVKDEIERGYNDTIGLDSISSATLKYCLELMEGEQRKHDAIEEMYKRKSKPSVESCQSDDSDDSHDYHGYQPECAANTHYFPESDDDDDDYQPDNAASTHWFN
jgi:hypothetical protein